MSNSSTIVEWLNENENRCYPLVNNDNMLVTYARKSWYINRLIVDALLIYSSIPATVSLNSIVTSASDMQINVQGLDPFIITNYITAAYPYYARTANNSILVVGSYAKGFPTNAIIKISNITFEPSTVVELYPSNTGLSSLTIAGNTQLPEVVLTEGYQLSLTPSNNTLTMEVGRNEGIPLPCLSVKNLPGDCPEGGDCCEIVSGINGVTSTKSGGMINIVAGKHVKIFNDAANNRIYIGFDFKASDIPTQKLPAPLATI